MRTFDVPSPDKSAADDLDAVRGWLDARRSGMVDELAAYVGLETPSNDKALLDEGLAWVRRQVIAALGPPIREERSSRSEHGDALVLDFDGTGSNRLLLMCHYDTVWNAGTLRDWPFAIDGDIASGPGVFDMKSGLIQGLWALRALDANGLPRPPLRLLLNGDEEIGSPSSRAVIEAAASGVAAALVLEPSEEGALKTARKGVGIVTLDVCGVEAHAGLDPDKGASAIRAVAELTLQLHRLSDPAHGTTVNVGVVNGGTRTNVIAGRARASVDLRVVKAAEAARIDAALAELCASDPRVTVTVGGGWNRPVMERTPEIGEMFALAQAIAHAQGLQLRETAAGGGSDGNFLAGKGLPLLDGLGAVGAGAHARNEHVIISAMPERAALVAGILHAFARRAIG